MNIQTKKIWVGIGWRGYYIFENSVYSSALLLGDDFGNKEVLSDLIRIKKTLKQSSIPFKTIKTNGSNVCSVGVDILVPSKLINKAKEILQ